MLIGAVRASGEFFTDGPLMWVMLVGFLGVTVGSAHLLLSGRE
jgi:hypothetical protein